MDIVKPFSPAAAISAAWPKSNLREKAFELHRQRPGAVLAVPVPAILETAANEPPAREGVDPSRNVAFGYSTSRGCLSAAMRPCVRRQQIR